MKNLLVALLLAAPSAALAAAYAIPTQSPRDLALQQSNVATQEGAGAVMANLAALSRLEGASATAALEIVDNSTEWSDPTLGSSKTVKHPAYPPTLALAWGGQLPGGRRYGVGAGMLVGGGGSLFWPEGWAGSTRIREVDQRWFIARAGGGIEVGAGLRLGGGLVFHRITEVLKQDVNFVSSVGTAEVGLAGNGWSFAASAEYDVPNLPLTLGVDYRHQAKFTLKGDAHFEGVPPAYQPLLQDQGAKQETAVPNELFVGLAWKVHPGVRLTGAWSHERWIVYKEDKFVGDKGFTVDVPRNYKNGWVYRLGLEDEHPAWAPPLTLRVGAQRSISNPPTDTLSPTLSDASSWGFSGGAGWQLLPSLRVDAAYMLALLDDITATGNDALPGTYKTKVNFFTFGLTWSPK
ncbi:MAG: outer membrane protein transport protein [Anaeromyxobacter sp.]